MRAAPMGSYLVLLRAGFTMPRTVASRAVRSYRTVSPLPVNFDYYEEDNVGGLNINFYCIR